MRIIQSGLFLNTIHKVGYIPMFVVRCESEFNVSCEFD